MHRSLKAVTAIVAWPTGEPYGLRMRCNGADHPRQRQARALHEGVWGQGSGSGLFDMPCLGYAVQSVLVLRRNKLRETGGRWRAAFHFIFQRIIAETIIEYAQAAIKMIAYCRRCAASRVLTSSMVIVIGPTPPGTGVM